MVSLIFEIIYETINDQDNLLSVSELCKMAGVSKSDYYRWLKAAQTRKEREEQDRKDFDLILDAFKHRGYDKGAKGIYMNLKKIRRLMKKYNLICPKRGANPYRRMAKALKTSNYADNLVNREFEMHGPRKILLTDIPYNGVFAYLSTIIDAFIKELLS